VLQVQNTVILINATLGLLHHSLSKKVEREWRLIVVFYKDSLLIKLCHPINAHNHLVDYSNTGSLENVIPAQ